MKNEKEFFREIEDTLHAYEDAYVPGAWEAFQQKRDTKPTGLLFLKIGSAAAILLLAAYATFMFWVKTPVTVELAGNKPPVQQPVVKPAPSSVLQSVQPSAIDSVTSSTPQSQIAIANQPSKQQSTANNSQIVKSANSIIATAKQKPVANNNTPLTNPFTVKPDTTLIANNNIAIAKNNPVSNDIQNPVTQNSQTVNAKPAPATNQAIANNNISKQTGADKPSYDNLVNSKSSKAIVAKPKSADEKALSYSVVVQPGIGNQKINMGTGVQVAYKLSDRISVTSGISYSSVSATGSGSVAAGRIGGVQNVNVAVAGVEVPLGIQYKTDKGYYVSAAVMGMSVTSNSMQYNYIAQSTLASTAYDKQGLSYSALSVVSENKTEESKEKVANYLGFYILSAGRKYPVGKKNNLILGPFLRVPFGAVSSEKVRLLQGGVTVGFGF